MRPKISIIISTYNRSSSLLDTLRSLSEMVVPEEIGWEVLIIDNNSNDETKSVIQNFIRKNRHLNFKYVMEPRQGKSFALNLGVETAEGEIIAFIDDDVLVDKNWIVNLFQCFKLYDCDGVGGRILPIFSDRTPEWVKQNRDLLGGPLVIYNYGESIQIYDKNRHFPFIGANMAFKKSCFIKYGLFRTDLGPGRKISSEDTEFFSRVSNENSKLYYCGNALVYHKFENERVSWQYLAKWYMKAGRFDATVADTASATLYFGIPRYILRQLATATVLFTVNLFDKRSSLKHFRLVFWNIGKCLQYIDKKNAQDQYHHPNL